MQDMAYQQELKERKEASKVREEMLEVFDKK